MLRLIASLIKTQSIRATEDAVVSEKSAGVLTGLARAGQDGARATARYYAGAGKEEKRLVKASFFTGITSGVLWYVLIYYWAALEFTSEQIGIMGGVGSAVAITTYLFGGYLADRLGRKKLFLVGLVCTAAGLIIFLSPKDLVVYTIAFGLTSLGGSLQWPALTSLLAAKASPSDMKYLYGMQMFVNQIGLTIATFLGIFGPQHLKDLLDSTLAQGYTVVFIGTAICAFVPIIYVLRVTESERSTEKLRVHFDKRMQKILFMYCFQNALIGFGAALVIPWLPVIFNKAMGASDSWVSMILTVSNIVIAAGWFVVPWFARFRGSVALITVCQIASVVPMILIPYSPTLIIVALLYTSRSFLMLVPSPVLNAYVMNIVSEKIRASFLSMTQLAWQIAYAGAYVIAGYLWANDYSKVEPFFYAGALYVVASLIFYAYFRHVREAEGIHSETIPT